MVQTIQAIDCREPFDEGSDAHAEQEQDCQKDVAPAQLQIQLEKEGVALDNKSFYGHAASPREYSGSSGRSRW